MAINRRDFVSAASMGAAGLALGSAGAALGALSGGVGKRPNILLILVDQMRHPMWTTEGIMPNMERIQKEGTTFTNSFVSASPCSPSRACLWTGTYTTQNKMFSNCDFVEGKLQESLDPRIPTMGHVFGRNGYQVPYRGKWHLTRRADRPNGLADYGFEGWGPPDSLFGGPPYGGVVMDPYYTRQTVRWLLDENNHKEPWLHVCSLINPHDVGAWPRYYPQSMAGPIEADAPPPNYDDDLSGKPRVHKEYQERFSKMAGKVDETDPDVWRRYLDHYAWCMRDVDENIGDVLDALEKSGQKDNTVVVFTSDHGEMGGSHGLRNKGTYAYEEVMKVPLVVAAPGLTPPGSTSDALVSNVDIFPTLASLAGIKDMPYQAGVDFSHLIGAPAGDAGRDHVIYHNDWEIVFTIGKGASEASVYDNPAHIRCIRDKEWKYAYYFSVRDDAVEHELYNLKDDPLEMDNLAGDAGYRKKRDELKERLFEDEARFEKDFEV